MADIKREDITLSDWTKGISADEFAWGSYFYSEAISTGYSTKGFELWYRLGKNKINSRPQWYATSLSPSHNYWFMATTRDGRIECQYTWNWSSYWDWDTDGGGALYSYYEWSWVGTGYLNWVTYWDYIFWIRDTRVEKIKVDEVFDPSAEMLWETDMSVATWWTIGTWWTITDNWAEHTAGETADLSYDLSWESMPASENYRVAIKISNCTAGYIEASLWNTGFQWESGVNGWVVYNLRWYTTPILTLTPSSSFNWTIEKVNVHHYDGDKITSIGIYWWTYSNKHPALVWDPLVVEADGSSRPCRGRDAGSALAPATQTLLCWCSAYLYRRPLPPQLRTGGSWSASVGPKERDDPGEGRRALGEKAFSSDPRGSLGVSDPPAAAPPECAVAAVAAAKSAWAEHPAPHLSSGGGGGRVRRPRGGAVCRSLPTAARASPLRVGGGSRWAPPGVPAGGGGPERACAASEDLVDAHDDYESYVEEQEDNGNFNYDDFGVWRAKNERN